MPSGKGDRNRSGQDGSAFDGSGSKAPHLALGAALSFLDSSMSTTPVQVWKCKATDQKARGKHYALD